MGFNFYDPITDPRVEKFNILLNGYVPQEDHFHIKSKPRTQNWKITEI